MMSHALNMSGEKKNKIVLIIKYHAFNEKAEVCLGLKTTLKSG